MAEAHRARPEFSRRVARAVVAHLANATDVATFAGTAHLDPGHSAVDFFHRRSAQDCAHRVGLAGPAASASRRVTTQLARVPLEPEQGPSESTPCSH